MSLIEKKCVPCEGNEAPMEVKEATKMMEEISEKWSIEGNKSLQREFRLTDFQQSMKFVNQIAQIAETEGHHPDIEISYDRVKIKLTTHAIDGLSENDFIVAAKIDLLAATKENVLSKETSNN